MEWRIKLEAKTGWGKVTEVEIGTVSRRVVSATDEDVGLSLTESKAILSTLQQAIVTAQLDEYVTCARVCGSCLAFCPFVTAANDAYWSKNARSANFQRVEEGPPLKQQFMGI